MVWLSFALESYYTLVKGVFPLELHNDQKSQLITPTKQDGMIFTVCVLWSQNGHGDIFILHVIRVISVHMM